VICSSACIASTGQPGKQSAVQPGSKTAGMTQETLRSTPRPKLASGRTIDTKSSNVRTVRGSLSADLPRMDDGSFFSMHSLRLNAGDRVVATMRSSDFDSYLLLMIRDGESVRLLAENDDHEGLNARIAFRAESAAEYILVANSAGAGEVGDYQISVEIQPSTSVSQPQPTAQQQARPVAINIGQTVSGSLISGTSPRLADDTLYNVHTFEGREGDVVEISLMSSDFDAYLILTDGAGNSVAFDDDSGQGYNSLLRVTLPSTGRFSILANCVGSEESGRYELSLARSEQAQESIQNRDFATMYPGGGSANERYALLVGIDDYPGAQNDLASCVNDTRVMRQALIEHFGYKPENIVVINDASATREHIIEAFRRHLGQAGPNGAATFYFSGHGMQMDGNYGIQDEEPEGVDEALFVWGNGPATSIILDDELNVLISELRPQNKMVILDNCNAGTGTLGAGFKFVSMDDESIKSALRLPDTWLGAEILGARGVAHGGMNHVFLAACKAEETALAGSNGRPSVFTHALIRQIEAGGADMPVDEFMRQVRMSVRLFINEILEIEHNQTPQHEGSAQAGSVRAAFGQR